MSGPGGPNDERDPWDMDFPEPGDEPHWPSRDLDEPTYEPDAAQPHEPAAAPSGEPWDIRRWGERRRPTTAEQAVPWLIGLVLALAGIVIVLLALIFTDANGGFASDILPTPTPELPISPAASPSRAGSPKASPTASVAATASPTPLPKYGSLEMLYLARPNGAGVSELFRDDFANATAARVVARTNADITHYAVSPDGTVSAAIVNGKLVALAAGKDGRTIASSVNAVTFGSDARTVYAVTVTRSGSTDTATIDAIGFADGKAKNLATISFPHPSSTQPTALGSARFFDEGGAYRLYATSDGNLVFWAANGGQWRIDPVSGDQVAVSRQPVLWTPDGSRRIRVGENGLLTTLTVVDQSGATSAHVSISGLISHLRWSPKGNKVVFTLGRTSLGGGIRQDLYSWDLVNGRAPVALTANGASFGGEWLGVAQFWQP
jgi:hypothetical protein